MDHCERNGEHNEHCLFFQLSDQPLGPMETRRPYGLDLRRLGSRLGFVASLGYRRADNNLSGEAITVSTRLVFRRNKAVPPQVFLAVNFTIEMKTRSKSI